MKISRCLITVVFIAVYFMTRSFVWAQEPSLPPPETPIPEGDLVFDCPSPDCLVRDGSSEDSSLPDPCSFEHISQPPGEVCEGQPLPFPSLPPYPGDEVKPVPLPQVPNRESGSIEQVIPGHEYDRDHSVLKIQTVSSRLTSFYRAARTPYTYGGLANRVKWQHRLRVFLLGTGTRESADG